MYLSLKKYAARIAFFATLFIGVVLLNGCATSHVPTTQVSQAEKHHHGPWVYRWKGHRTTQPRAAHQEPVIPLCEPSQEQ